MDELERARACADRMYADDNASQTLGIEVEIPKPGTAIATMRVREDMVNGFNICHGGLVFALADTAFAFACARASCCASSARRAATACR